MTAPCANCLAPLVEVVSLRPPLTCSHCGRLVGVELSSGCSSQGATMCSGSCHQISTESGKEST